MDPRILAGEDSYRNEGGIKADPCKHHEQEASILHAEEVEVEVQWGDLHRTSGNRQSCDDDRQSDGDYAPAELKMKSTITHGNQPRLDEKAPLPRRNGEAADKVEAENGRVDHPAGYAGAACEERAETYEHDHEKAAPGRRCRTAVEPL